MAMAARWIRQGTVEPRALLATIAGLALAQNERSAPILLWARVAAGVEDDILVADGDRFAFALVVPERLAPGRLARRAAWVLAPAIAAYRQLGVRAYADGNEIWLNGRRIARGAAEALGGCVIATASFLPGIPGAGFEEKVIEAVFRARLEAQHGWQFDTSWASARERAAIADALSEPVAAR